MKYWYVRYSKDKAMYQLEMAERLALSTEHICVFANFDMAYQYVTRLNGSNDVQAYSKWTITR